MAITSPAVNNTGINSAANLSTQTLNGVENNTFLNKDDFLTLLLVELQHQDPTSPTDSEKILSQTSQLATLEASQNTSDALADLSNSLKGTQEFSIINSIGKRADLGSDAITHDKGSPTVFEVYYPEDIASGTVDITDIEGNSIATLPIEVIDANGDDADKLDAGVRQFRWDGLDAAGNPVDTGIYKVSSNYRNPDGQTLETRLGAYPIESVKFENGKALLKLGSNYIPLEDIVEVY